VVIIIGAGISGLSAAYELATRRVPFVLLEASDRTGGLIRTERTDGYTIDAGADSILASKPAAIQLCEELGLGPRLMASTPPRTAYVHARGRLHALPSPSVFGIPTTWAGMATYELLPMSARVRLAWNVARGAGSPPAEGEMDESVAEFYRRRFGPATVGLVAEPLLGGIHAGDVEKLSVAAVAPRLAAASRLRLAGERSSTTAGADGLFKALRGGMGELVAAIESRLPAGSVRVNSPVHAVARAGGAWQIASDAGRLDARAVIVAAPAHAAAGLLASTDAAVAALCAEVPYVSTVSVALAWPRASVQHPLRGSGFVVAQAHSKLRITACTWVSSKWEDRAPEGMVLLRAFLGGAADEAAVDLSDDALVEIATSDVSKVLRASGAPHFARVQRWRRAGAQHNVGHAARLSKLAHRIDALPGLFVAGSGFRSIGVPDCVADGRAAAVQAARYIALESN
jgi:protoporphyrinogen/coproporphyrinogen III oxidase